jgi:hypothetical protein
MLWRELCTGGPVPSKVSDEEIVLLLDTDEHGNRRNMWNESKFIGMWMGWAAGFEAGKNREQYSNANS